MRHSIFVPDYLCERLKQAGLDLEEETGGIVIWQHATDFLRDEYNTHIIISPGEDEEGFTGYDYSLLTPYGEPFDLDGVFPDYYEALEDAIDESLNCIEEGITQNQEEEEEDENEEDKQPVSTGEEVQNVSD